MSVYLLFFVERNAFVERGEATCVNTNKRTSMLACFYFILFYFKSEAAPFSQSPL